MRNSFARTALLISFFLKAVSVQASSIEADPLLMRKVGECRARKGQPLILIKQWHLPASANTHTGKLSPSPQAENQTEIYDQLQQWTEKKQVDTVVAEGCSAKDHWVMNEKFPDKFQGWSALELKAKMSDPAFRKIEAHPVLKLALKAGDSVRALCGDDLTEIKKSQLALSDARAAISYLGKFENKEESDPSLAPYLQDVRELYHLKKDEGAVGAKTALKADLKKSIQDFENSTHARDLVFSKTAKDSGSTKPVVVVVGGLHAADLVEILNQSGQACEVFEPLHYLAKEEELKKSLQQALKAMN